MKRLLLKLILSALPVLSISAQQAKPFIKDFKYFLSTANYDENLVPAYTLPDPLLCMDGSRVTTREEWENKRRPELMRLITTYMYGHAPILSHPLLWSVDTVETKALKGLCTRKVITIHLTDRTDGPVMHLQLFIPNKPKDRVPAILGISFSPNSSIPKAKEWQLRRVLDQGYALATFHYTEVVPDKANTTLAYDHGLMPYFYRKGQTYPDPDQWGTIAVWAWAASRAMDYLQTDDRINPRQVAIMGHSRLGKTALWAGATDERFAVVLPVNSGCCGAALSKRKVGERVESINTIMPYWFCNNYKQFSDREQYMPFDQHEVIALCAPRPVYIASAEEDNWSDQRGEFLGAKGAEPVYALYGEAGIGIDRMPPVDVPYNKGFIAYHIRKGAHAVLEYDWEQFFIFMDRFFKRSH